MKMNNSNLKKRLAIVKGGMIEGITFRMSYIVTLFGTIMYFVIIYSLWTAVYLSNNVESVRGFTYEKTIIYLVLATAMGSFIEIPIVWEMDSKFQSGKIIFDISKPMKYKKYLFWEMFGRRVDFFIVVFVPLYLLLMFSLGDVKLWMSNFPVFFISCLFSIVISYFIDFIVGIFVFFTHSVWGINALKCVIVSLCSGATIPIDMFPDAIKNILYCFPFKCIYDVPIKLLLNNNNNLIWYIKELSYQLIWVIILSIVANIIWNNARRIVMINGG